MEDLILESRLHHISASKTHFDYHLRVSNASHLDGKPNRPFTSLKQPGPKFSRIRSREAGCNASWGRSGSAGSLPTTAGCVGILVLCPLLVIFL